MKLMRTNWAHKTNQLIELYEYRLMIMRHWRSGGRIQFRLIGLNEDWTTSNDPNWEPAWDWNKTEYRIQFEAVEI